MTWVQAFVVGQLLAWLLFFALVDEHREVQTLDDLADLAERYLMKLAGVGYLLSVAIAFLHLYFTGAFPP